MKGFKTAFELYESGIRLNMDYSTRIIRTDNLLLEYNKAIKSGVSSNDFIANNIIDKSFITLYGNQRIIRISDVDMKITASSPFPD